MVKKTDLLNHPSIWHVSPSKLKGSLVIPPSKSHSVRALLFAIMAKGTSIIERPLNSPDFQLLLDALASLGVRWHWEKNDLYVQGCGGDFNPPSAPLYLGNSGIALRFLTALLSLSSQPFTLTGDQSLQKREMQPLLCALKKGGVQITGTKAPFTLCGPFNTDQLSIEAEDSQYLSALLMMAPFTKNGLTLTPKIVKEKPYIEMTLEWLRRLGLVYEREEYATFIIPGEQTLRGFHCKIPGDFSTLAFPLVAALLSESELIIEGVNFSDTQGDKQVVSFLESLGAQFEKTEKTIRVKKSGRLSGGEISLGDQIDALPILALVGCFCNEPLILREISGAQNKECDRPKAVIEELSKLGANFEWTQDTLTVYPSSLKAGVVSSHGDHRMALMLAVAGMVSHGDVRIHGCCCAEKTFPNFVSTMQQIGVKIACIFS